MHLTDLRLICEKFVLFKKKTQLEQTVWITKKQEESQIFKSLTFLMLLATGSLHAEVLLCPTLLNSQSNSIQLPRELNTRPQTLSRIAENGHRNFLLTLSTLFKKYEDPVLMNKLSYSFRRYNIDQINLQADEVEDSRNRGVFERLRGGMRQLVSGAPPPAEEDVSFEEVWENLDAHFKNRVDVDQVRPMFFAIKANFEGGFLNNEEILVTAFLMARGNLDFKYKTNGRLDVYLREQHTEVTPQAVAIAKSYKENPIHLKNWNRLIKDPGFKLFIKALLDADSIRRDPMPQEAHRLLEKVLKKSFQFKPKIWQTQSIIGILLTLVEDHIFDYVTSFQTASTDQVDRTVFLNGLEEALVLFLEDSSLARVYLNFQDYYVFKTPFPVDPKKIENSFIEGAKNILLPFKSEVAQQVSAEVDEGRAAELEQGFSTWVTTNTRVFRPTQVNAASQVRNPRKRKNRSCNTFIRTELRVESGTETQSEANLCPESQIAANTPYTFYLLRNPEMPLQTIVFSDTLVDEFNSQNTVNWPEFIRPLLYGFTSERGQNGIKKLGSNMNLKNIYEIKPGVSSYRILMRREGNTWETLAFLHKDNVDRFLNSL